MLNRTKLCILLLGFLKSFAGAQVIDLFLESEQVGTATVQKICNDSRFDTLRLEMQGLHGCRLLRVFRPNKSDLCFISESPDGDTRAIKVRLETKDRMIKLPDGSYPESISVVMSDITRINDLVEAITNGVKREPNSLASQWMCKKILNDDNLALSEELVVRIYKQINDDYGDLQLSTEDKAKINDFFLGIFSDAVSKGFSNADKYQIICNSITIDRDKLSTEDLVDMGKFLDAVINELLAELNIEKALVMHQLFLSKSLANCGER